MAGFDADTELQQPSEFALVEPHHDPSAIIEFNGSVVPAGVSPIGAGPASRWDRPHAQVILCLTHVLVLQVLLKFVLLSLILVLQ